MGLLNNQIMITYLAQKLRKSFKKAWRLYLAKCTYDNDNRQHDMEGICGHVKHKQKMKRYKCNYDILNVWRNLEDTVYLDEG
jgi:hypothetical protein